MHIQHYQTSSLISRQLPPMSAPSPKQLYFELLASDQMPGMREASLAFLHSQLHEIESSAADFPSDVEALEAWVIQNSEDVGRQYRTYLKQRA